MDHPWLNRAEQALVEDRPVEARVLVSGYMRQYPDDADARLLLARLNAQGTDSAPLPRRRVALPEEIWKTSLSLPRPAWLSAPASTRTDPPAVHPRANPAGTRVSASVAPSDTSFPLLWFLVPLFLVFAESLLPLFRVH